MLSKSPHQSSSKGRPGPPLTGFAPSSPIEKLDHDTFLLILEYAMDLNVDHLHDLQAYLSHRVEGEFPSGQYLGCVSRMWRNVYISTPSLWTRIRYFVDAPDHTHELQQLRLQTYLQRSYPLNIHLYLCRRRSIPQSLDFEEAELVEAALNGCSSHFERVEVLMVETNQASSLPRALSLLQSEDGDFCQLPRLTKLIMNFNIDDAILSPHPSPIPLPISTLFPISRALTSLFVDGRNLLAMLRLSKSRMPGSGVGDAFTNMPMLEEMGVNNLTSRVDGFSDELVHHLLADILPSFRHLKTLAFENLDPGVETLAAKNDLVYPLSLPRVVVKRTSQPSIEFILKWFHPQTLVLIDCSFVAPLPLPSLSKLILIEIPDDIDHARIKPVDR
ncbi:hypothetical protein MD484_g6546, partial [Candolleomyces efflorescens]